MAGKVGRPLSAPHLFLLDTLYPVVLHRITEPHQVAINAESTAMHFPISEYAFYLFSLYPTCAVIFSDSRFHRVWSLSLSLLWLLVARLLDQPFSNFSVPLALLALLVAIVCIILSPAQLVLFNTNPIGIKKKALRIYSPRDRETVSIESVTPVKYLNISISDLTVSSLVSLLSTVLRRIQQQHGCLDYQATTSLQPVTRPCGCGTFYQWKKT